MKNRAKIMMMALTLVALLDTAKAQTELYKKYEHLEDVTVVCIMKLPINDTMTVQVTLLAPQTKEAVYYLAEEFNLGIEKDIIDEGLGKKGTALLTRNVYKNDVTKLFRAINKDEDFKDISVLAYNCNTGALLIFHNIETIERARIVSKFLNNSLKNPEILNDIEQIIK